MERSVPRDEGIKEEEVAISNKDEFVWWFRQTTGLELYPFQIRFACETAMPELVDVPTGELE
jgi:hypothetical protein